MTKSGTSAKGEMRLVPKPAGTSGGLNHTKIKSVAVGRTDSQRVKVAAHPLYSFRYSGSAPAVYNSKLSEQVVVSLAWTSVAHHSWKTVLLLTASVNAEAGYESPNAHRTCGIDQLIHHSSSSEFLIRVPTKGAGSIKGLLPSCTAPYAA